MIKINDHLEAAYDPATKTIEIVRDGQLFSVVSGCPEDLTEEEVRWAVERACSHIFWKQFDAKNAQNDEIGAKSPRGARKSRRTGKSSS